MDHISVITKIELPELIRSSVKNQKKVLVQITVYPPNTTKNFPHTRDKCYFNLTIQMLLLVESPEKIISNKFIYSYDFENSKTPQAPSKLYFTADKFIICPKKKQIYVRNRSCCGKSAVFKLI